MTPSKSGSKNNDAALYAARDAAIAAMPDIINAIIDKAKEGNYLHAKFLLDFACGNNAAPPVTGDEQSLAAMLLKELREEPIA